MHEQCADVAATASISQATATFPHRSNRLMDQTENGKHYLPTATLVIAEGTK
jgi:hypothetical protein